MTADKLKEKYHEIMKGQHVLCVYVSICWTVKREEMTQLGIQSENHHIVNMDLGRDTKALVSR